MKARRQCTCGGTSPGFPQHEYDCDLRREDHDYDDAPHFDDNAPRVSDDPWEDAEFDDSPPFE